MWGKALELQLHLCRSRRASKPLLKSCFCIFFIWLVLLASFFPWNLFPAQLRLSQKFYLKKIEVKCPPNAKSLASGFAFMRWLGFYTIACEEQIFMLYRKKRTNIFLTMLHCELGNDVLCIKQQWQLYVLRRVERSDNDEYNFMS